MVVHGKRRDANCGARLTRRIGEDEAMNILDYFFGAEMVGQFEGQRPVSSGPDMSLWASRPDTKPATQVEVLTRRVGQLSLAVAALVRLCVKQGLAKPAELSALMREIDLEDGREDGQLNERAPQTPEWCPKCEAKIATGKPYCMFCGQRFDGNQA
jgi:hypothetical protein